MFIYGLRLKNSDEYRYVGLTSRSMQTRFRHHINYTKNPKLKNYPVNDWINKYGEEQICIDLLEELQSGSYKELQEIEIFWISAFKYLGYKLLNISSGGAYNPGPRGSSNGNYGKFGANHPAYGRKVSDQEKLLSSQAKLGPKNPNYGKPMSTEQKMKISLATKGVSRPETKTNAHKRWHTNKNICKPDTCQYCKEELNDI